MRNYEFTSYEDCRRKGTVDWVARILGLLIYIDGYAFGRESSPAQGFWVN